jgi:hypothetical protein
MPRPSLGTAARGIRRSIHGNPLDDEGPSASAAGEGGDPVAAEINTYSPASPQLCVGFASLIAVSVVGLIYLPHKTYVGVTLQGCGVVVAAEHMMLCRAALAPADLGVAEAALIATTPGGGLLPQLVDGSSDTFWSTPLGVALGDSAAVALDRGAAPAAAAPLPPVQGLLVGVPSDSNSAAQIVELQSCGAVADGPCATATGKVEVCCKHGPQHIALLSTVTDAARAGRYWRLLVHASYRGRRHAGGAVAGGVLQASSVARQRMEHVLDARLAEARAADAEGEGLLTQVGLLV